MCVCMCGKDFKHTFQTAILIARYSVYMCVCADVLYHCNMAVIMLGYKTCHICPCFLYSNVFQSYIKSTFSYRGGCFITQKHRLHAELQITYVMECIY